MQWINPSDVNSGIFCSEYINTNPVDDLAPHVANLSTVRCHYNAVQNNILYTAQ